MQLYGRNTSGTLGEREIEGRVFPLDCFHFEFSQTSTSYSITYGNTGGNVFYIFHRITRRKRKRRNTLLYQSVNPFPWPRSHFLAAQKPGNDWRPTRLKSFSKFSLVNKKNSSKISFICPCQKMKSVLLVYHHWRTNQNALFFKMERLTVYIYIYIYYNEWREECSRGKSNTSKRSQRLRYFSCFENTKSIFLWATVYTLQTSQAITGLLAQQTCNMQHY